MTRTDSSRPEWVSSLADVAPRARRPTLLWGVTLLGVVLPSPGVAQGDAESAALSVAHAALAAISAEDAEGLAGLMLDGATIVAVPGDGGSPRVSTRADVLSTPMTADFVERGFDGETRVAGTLATVWLPYDFYRDGEWSHCGVDVFTMVWDEGDWRIANLTYSVQQPPACRAHPDGAPGA